MRRPSGDHRGLESREVDGASQVIDVPSVVETPMNA